MRDFLTLKSLRDELSQVRAANRFGTYLLLTVLVYGFLVGGILLYLSQRGSVGMFLFCLMFFPASFLHGLKMGFLSEIRSDPEPPQESCPWKNNHHSRQHR